MTPDQQDEESLESVPLTGPDCEQYRAALHRFLIRRLRNDQDAQDLAQETYLRFYQLGNTHSIRRPVGYLYRIAVNLVYEIRLRRSRERVTFDSQMVDAMDEGTSDPASIEPSVQLAAEEQVSRVLFSVPAAYRKLLILHLRDGMSAREIAATTHSNQRTVEANLAKALAFARNARWT